MLNQICFIVLDSKPTKQNPVTIVTKDIKLQTGNKTRHIFRLNFNTKDIIVAVDDAIVLFSHSFLYFGINKDFFSRKHFVDVATQT